MAEPIVAPVTPDVTPPVTPDATPPVTPTPDTTNYFGTDGVLNEGWQGTLDEDLRDEKSLISFKSVGDLAKSFVNTKKMVGKNVVAIPTDASTEGEWQEYHKAGGRPETVADYNLGVPEGFPEEIKAQVFPEGRIEKWQERFFKGGVSKKAADAFIVEFTQDILADYQKVQQAKETAKAELVSTLSTEYGAAFDQKLHLGDLAVEDFAGDDVAMKESLAYLREDPNAIKLLVHFGSMLAEGKPPSATAIPTPGDYQDQIDALMADPLYTNGTQPQRLKIAEKIMAIRKLQKPEPATT